MQTNTKMIEPNDFGANKTRKRAEKSGINNSHHRRMEWADLISLEVAIVCVCRSYIWIFDVGKSRRHEARAKAEKKRQKRQI